MVHLPGVADEVYVALTFPVVSVVPLMGLSAPQLPGVLGDVVKMTAWPGKGRHAMPYPGGGHWVTVAVTAEVAVPLAVTVVGEAVTVTLVTGPAPGLPADLWPMTVEPGVAPDEETVTMQLPPVVEAV